MRGIRWTLVLLGLWIASTAVVEPESALHLWSGLLVGSSVVILGFSITGHAAWQGSLEVLLGAWVAFSAIEPLMESGGPLCWGNLLVGFAVALVMAIPTDGFRSETLRG